LSFASVKAIFFDVGETLVAETRMWQGAAASLGVSNLEFFAALGALIERREDHRKIFEWFGRPGTDIISVGRERVAAGEASDFLEQDLYADAVPALSALREAGFYVGIAANQPSERETTLNGWKLPVDVVGTSQSWGVAKPSPQFFQRMAEVAGVEPHEVMYVGDRVDNDVIPAVEAGMTAVLLRRGPWGVIQCRWLDAERAHLAIDSLEELVAALCHDTGKGLGAGSASPPGRFLARQPPGTV
jgi:HAD superfamily hydrolase (TIGR01549 family)